MKKNKLFMLVVVFCLCFALVACTDQQESDVAETDAGQETGAVSSNIDVDLTQLSSTMIYAEVYNMMSEPEEYIGKTVKMDGAFALYQAVDENGESIPDMIYFACVVEDATACCAQGIEFVLAGEHSYPEDYPELGSAITVTGEFQTYEENGYTYLHLVDASLEV